jgi:predicted ATP-binding protein involved in virulence
MVKEPHRAPRGDFRTYPEAPKRNSVSSYMAYKKILKCIISNISPKMFEAITGKKIKVSDFQDYHSPEEAFSETMRLEIDDRLNCLPEDELVEINRMSPNNAEWLVKYIFNRRIRKTQN